MKENKNEMKKYIEITSITLSYEEKVKIANSSEVYKILTTILKREGMLEKYKEHFWVLGIDNEDTLLSINTVSIGDIESVSSNPMNTFSYLILQGARYTILAHNHTGQDVKPSEADIDTTCRLYNCGEILKIPVKDHVIISEHTYFSFLDMGVMDDVRTDLRYIPNHLVEERFITEAKRIKEKAHKKGLEEGISKGTVMGLEKGIEQGIEKGRHEEKIEAARIMLKDKLNIETIMKYTSLAKEEIEKIKN